MFNIIDVIVVLIILLSVFMGYKKGFVKTVINLASFFVAIGLALMFYKPLAVILTENTTIDDWVIENIISSDELREDSAINNDEIYLEENQNDLENTQNSDNAEDVQNTSEEADKNISSEVMSDKTNESNGILKMLEDLPSIITNNVELEEIKENTKHEIAYKVSELIMNLLSLISIYVVVKVTLLIASFVLNGIMQIPVLKQINEIFGMGIGAIIGFIQVYLAFAVITFLTSVCDISAVISTIKASAFASVLFENNLIINLLF